MRLRIEKTYEYIYYKKLDSIKS